MNKRTCEFCGDETDSYVNDPRGIGENIDMCDDCLRVIRDSDGWLISYEIDGRTVNVLDSNYFAEEVKILGDVPSGLYFSPLTEAE